MTYGVYLYDSLLTCRLIAGDGSDVKDVVETIHQVMVYFSK